MFLLFDGDYIEVLAVLDDEKLALEIIIENENQFDEEVLDIKTKVISCDWIVYEVFYKDSDENGTNKYNLIGCELNKLI